MKYIVTIEHDPESDSPADMDGQWSIYSFNRFHTVYVDPHDYLPATIALRRKIQVGLAYIIYDTNGDWHIDTDPELNDPYNRHDYGLLIWEHKPKEMGAKSYADRMKDAKQFLAQYNAWRNGGSYFYDIETEEGESVGGCGGFIVADDKDSEYVFDCIGAEIPEDAEVEFRGQDIGTPKWLRDGVKVDVTGRLLSLGVPNYLLDNHGVAVDWLEETGHDVTRLRELIGK